MIVEHFKSKEFALKIIEILNRQYEQETLKKIIPRKKYREIKYNKISESNIGRHWYNNGIENRFCYECPEGFNSGMLYERKSDAKSKNL